ncbi:uncharacterized protein LOC135207859 [Macrobrachium nipponense]|uniref:uncharacterized protein LOC135207859 n=1 Tax=Macrobrachium nipponense TaxID=159736 RepID=UPI0030C85E5A
MWRGFLLAALCVRGWSLRTAVSSVGQISRFSTAVIQSNNDTDSLIGNGEARRMEADVFVLLGSLLSPVYSGSRLLVLQDDYYSGVGFLIRSVHSSLSWDGIEVTSCQADALESWVRDSFRSWPSDIVALLICSASNAWDILQWVSEQKDEPTSLLKSVHWIILVEDGGLMPRYESILTEESQFTVAQMEPDGAITLLVTAFLQNGRMGFVPVGRWWRFQGKSGATSCTDL